MVVVFCVDIDPYRASPGTGNTPLDPILETQELVVEYEPGTRALDVVDLRIDRAEFISVIGPSGAGKSTLLRVMNRLLTPTSGEILLEGSPITHASGRSLRRVRQRVGMVFQQFNLVPQLTVLENVLVGWIGRAPLHHQIPALWRHFPASARAQALACLEQVHIADQARSRAGELSGGQQQRVAIARVLMQDPLAILADEPIASLDPGSAEIVMDTLLEINRDRGVPVIVNLHQVEIARKYSTRLVGLRQGRVLFDAAPNEIGDQHMARLYENRIHACEELRPTRVIQPKTHTQEGVLA